MDIVGKVFAYIFGVFLIFYVPIMLTTMKADQTIQTHANAAVEEFIDKARSTGIITSNTYEDMIFNLDATGVVYDVSITHSRGSATPKLDNDGNIILGKYYEYYEEFHDEEILKSLYPDPPVVGLGSYYMQEGDFVRVAIENTTPTLASRLYAAISPVHSGKTIFVSSGGYVGNEIEKD